jgi:hypothetical protein
LAIQQVSDLIVGLPTDEQPASALQGPLVSATAAAAATAPAATAAASPQSPFSTAGSSAAAPQGAGATAGNGATGNAKPPSAAVAAAPSPPKPAAAAVAARRIYAVRAGTYLDPTAAQRRAALLLNHGYHPQILSSQQADEGLTWYSVVVGQEKDMLATRREAAQFASDQGYQPEIVSWPLAPPGGAQAP